MIYQKYDNAFNLMPLKFSSSVPLSPLINKVDSSNSRLTDDLVKRGHLKESINKV